MESLEQQAKKVRRRGQIQKALLTALLIGGAMAVGATPRVDVLKLLTTKNRNSHRLRYQISEALARLSRQGLVLLEHKDGRRLARLTEKGIKELELEQEKATLQLQKKKRWDNRWRLVTFDIPERRRGTRIRLGHLMKECGFVRLQNSVWVYPYDCEKLVALLKAELKIGNNVLYVIAETIENDRWLREHFSV
jgi:CRISPR-associated endonuclease Cas2